MATRVDGDEDSGWVITRLGRIGKGVSGIGSGGRCHLAGGARWRPLALGPVPQAESSSSSSCSACSWPASGSGRSCSRRSPPSAARTGRRWPSRTVSGPAAAWTTCTSRTAASRPIRWPPCSPPPWANGAAASRVAGADISRSGVRERVDRAMTVTVAARDGADGALDGVPRLGRLDRALHRPVRHRLGHHAQLLGHRRHAQHQPRRGRARHRRGAVRHRHRPGRRHPGRARLQQDQHRTWRASPAGWRVSAPSSAPSCPARAKRRA